jgi:uncharacterized linocin/CFP29 family protein
MAYDRSPVPWTDEEWARVERTIQEEASRARVAATFLPLYGPLPPDTDFVRVQRLREPSGNGHLTIDDKTTVQLATLQVRVHLRGAQMADPELGSALQLFRRAANVLARLEDLVVFRGVKEGDTEASSDAPRLEPAGGIQSVPPIWQIRGEKVSEGLWTVASGEPTATEPARQPRTIEGEDRNQRGESLVSEVSASIGDLETSGHFGPFAVVLGQEFFAAAETPSSGSLVLPQDRIIPFLGGGSFLRSSALEPETGVVVALGGAPVDLVVATDISLDFLEVTSHPMFVFRVYEKIVLRIKQPEAIRGLRLPAVADAGADRRPDTKK